MARRQERVGGLTALHHACEQKNTPSTALLLRLGCDVNAQTTEIATADGGGGGSDKYKQKRPRSTPTLPLDSLQHATHAAAQSATLSVSHKAPQRNSVPRLPLELLSGVVEQVNGLPGVPRMSGVPATTLMTGAGGSTKKGASGKHRVSGKHQKQMSVSTKRIESEMNEDYKQVAVSSKGEGQKKTPGATTTGQSKVSGIMPGAQPAESAAPAATAVAADGAGSGSGAGAGAVSVWGLTPLHVAVKRRAEDVVKVLLAAGADPLRENSAGVTALDMARKLRAGAPILVAVEVAASARAEELARHSCKAVAVLEQEQPAAGAGQSGGDGGGSPGRAAECEAPVRPVVDECVRSVGRS